MLHVIQEVYPTFSGATTGSATPTAPQRDTIPCKMAPAVKRRTRHLSSDAAESNGGGEQRHVYRGVLNAAAAAASLINSWVSRNNTVAHPEGGITAPRRTRKGYIPSRPVSSAEPSAVPGVWLRPDGTAVMAPLADR